jgi:WhiB family transcriptional regulator, redox-sensing transcriptional regulator
MTPTATAAQESRRSRCFPVDTLARGACQGTDTEMFYSLSPIIIASAKAICRRCPVLAVCREWGIRREEFGIWGGLDELERRAIRRETHQPLRAKAVI